MSTARDEPDDDKFERAEQSDSVACSNVVPRFGVRVDSHEPLEEPADRFAAVSGLPNLNAYRRGRS